MNTLKTLALQTPKKALGVIVDIPVALQTPKKALDVYCLYTKEGFTR